MVKKILMKKKEKFIKICDLSVSKVLLDFINKELLPGTGITKNRFFVILVPGSNSLLIKTKSTFDTDKS